jgi:hypothetical protein
MMFESQKVKNLRGLLEAQEKISKAYMERMIELINKKVDAEKRTKVYEEMVQYLNAMYIEEMNKRLVAESKLAELEKENE